MPETATKLFNSIGFTDRTGFAALSVVLEVNSPFPHPHPVRIRTTRKHKFVTVSYVLRSENLPDNNDDAGWKETLIHYLADAMEQVLKKFKLDPSCVAEIRNLSPNPKGAPSEGISAHYAHDTSPDIEISIPLEEPPFDNQLQSIQQYSEALTSSLEEGELARWSAEEVGAAGYSIIFTTKKVTETVEAIRQFSSDFNLSMQTLIKVNETGTISRLRMFTDQ